MIAYTLKSRVYNLYMLYNWDNKHSQLIYLKTSLCLHCALWPDLVTGKYGFCLAWGKPHAWFHVALDVPIHDESSRGMLQWLQFSLHSWMDKLARSQPETKNVCRRGSMQCGRLMVHDRPTVHCSHARALTQSSATCMALWLWSFLTALIQAHCNHVKLV